MHYKGEAVDSATIEMKLPELQPLGGGLGGGLGQGLGTNNALGGGLGQPVIQP